MALKPLDRALVRELARVYMRAAVQDLLSNNPEPATNTKAVRGRRVKTSSRRATK